MADHRLFRATAVLLCFAVLVSVAAARTWTSRDGKFKTEADLIDFKEDVVRLKKSDGGELSVPLAKLSDEDQQFVRNRYPAVAEAGSGDDASREWKSRDGKFTTRARFVELADGTVRLEKDDGKIIEVPLTQLSLSDRTWVNSHSDRPDKAHSEAEPKSEDATEAMGRLESTTIEMKLVEMKVGKGARKKPDAVTRYVLGATNPQNFFWQSNQTANSNEERFKRLVTKDREYEYAKPFRAVATIGSEQYAFALDAAGKTPKGYNRLHIDLNRNGDLTDDAPFATKDIENEASANQTTSQSTFDGIKVPIERDGVKSDHVFGMFVHYMELPQFSRTTVQMRSLVYREGEIRHEGRKIRVLLLDQNSNGLFDDRVSFQNNPSYLRVAYGDLLLINPKLRGSRAAVSTGQDAHFVNKTVCVNDTFYKLDVSPLGDRVKLEPTELAVGYVSNRSPVFRAVVCCDDFGVMEIAGTKNQKIVLPAGKWQIASYTLGVSGGEATIVSASFA